VEHIFSQSAVNEFARLCGDNNPLHSDPSYASKTPFGGTIVHGILVSSLFSTLFGSTLNGSVYVNQTLSFKRPVHVGARVLARVEVQDVKERSSGAFLTCSSVAFLLNQAGERVLAVDGVATVLIPSEVLKNLRSPQQ
jgi:acyl dehydratase